MLYHLLYPLHTTFSAFNVFRYITFRTIYASLTALLICWLLGPWVIRKLTKYQIGQYVRTDGPATHMTKTGTPTMGGLLILFAITVATLLWGDLGNRYVWIVLLTTLAFGGVGMWDDYRKLVLRDSRGLPARWKYLWQSMFGIAAAVALYGSATLPAETQLLFPFIKDLVLDLGPFFILLTYLVIVGSSNAVNLTDGLDGLAILPTVLVAGALGVFAYASGLYK